MSVLWILPSISLQHHFVDDVTLPYLYHLLVEEKWLADIFDLGNRAFQIERFR